MINGYRSTLLNQKLANPDPQVIQNLGKVKVKKVDSKECGCDVKGCAVYKAELNLPKHLKLTFVGSTQGDPYEAASYQSIKYLQYSKYTGKAARWFVLDEALYIIAPNFNLGKHVNVQGIFEDPKAANEFKTCECDNGDVCYTGYDFEYPMPAAMLDTLKKLMMDSEFRFAEAHKSDQVNNGRDDNAELK